MAHSYSVGSSGIDGKFGAGTDSAVRTFQRSKGLSVDGLSGKNTFAALCR
ncbi:MAG: peptidoglycan-binding domain-containing protein [Oscillospiraceae bacterium]|jgi:peptidoglycan hydrolase-like protein with peptidoglycan-binding domain|nr:peptidoglycan-binding domain-containing protein [Oscillospiraceae bacterium]